MSGYAINRQALKKAMKGLKKLYRKKIEDLLKIIDVKKPSYHAILRRGIMGQKNFDKFSKYLDIEQILEEG